MKITLGSLVLCKILLVNPVQEKPRADGLKTYSTSTNMTVMQLANKDKNVINNNGYKEDFITGTVEEIQSRRKLVEVEKNKKYEYKEFHSLLIKTESLEKLLVGSESCALADKMIVNNDNQEFQKKVVDSIEKKPKKISDLKKNGNLNEEEFETVIKDNINLDDYDIVTDKKLIDKYVNKNESDIKKDKVNLNDEELKTIAEAVMKFDSKTDVKSSSNDIVTDIKIIPENKQVENLTVKENVEEKIVAEDKNDLSLFDFFEAKNKKVKEDVKPNIVKKEKTIQVAQNEIKKSKQNNNGDKGLFLYNRDTNILFEAMKKLIFD